MSSIIINPYVLATGGAPVPSPQSPQGRSPDPTLGSPFWWSPEDKLNYNRVELHLHGDGVGGESSPPGIIDSGSAVVTPESVTGVSIVATPGAYGLGGYALDFPASPESEIRYTDVTTSPLLWEFGTGDWTLEARVRFGGALPSPLDADIIAKWQDGAARSFRWYIENGDMYFRWSTTGSNQNTLGPFDMSDILADDNFITFMCHRDGGTFRCFANGHILGEGTMFSDMQNTAADLVIGNSDATTNFPFIGQMEEVRLIKGRALWSEQAESPFPSYPFATDEYYFHKCGLIAGFDADTEGSPEYYDESRHSHGPLSFFGTTAAIVPSTSPANPFGTGVLALESLSVDYATFPNDSAFYLTDEEFTIEGFIKFESINTGELGNCLMALYTNSGSQRGWAFYYDTSISPVGLTFLWSTTGADSFQAHAARGYAPNTGQWYHWVVERDNSVSPQQLRIFLDGEEQVVDGDSITGDSIHSSTDALNFGRVNTSGGFTRRHDGEIDECRIIVGKCLYKENFDPPNRIFTRDFARNDHGLWTPERIQGTVLAWYDADDEDTIDLVGSPSSFSPGRVNSWLDKGPNGIHLTTLSSSTAPEYLPFTHDGKKAVYYPNSNSTLDALFSPEITDGTNIPSVFVVASWGAPGAKGTFAGLFQLGATSSAWSATGLNLIKKNTGPLIYATGANALTLGEILNDGSPSHHEDASLYYGWFDDANNDVGGHYNGTDGGNSGDGGGATWDGFISVGNLRGATIGSGTSSATQEYIAEVIVLDYRPTDGERQIIEGYLAHKWRFNQKLPMDHPFRLYAP